PRRSGRPCRAPGGRAIKFFYLAQISSCSPAGETLVSVHAENQKNFQAQTESRLHETGPAGRQACCNRRVAAAITPRAYKKPLEVKQGALPAGQKEEGYDQRRRPAQAGI